MRIGLGIMGIGIALAGTGAVTARYLREIRAARDRIDGLGSQVVETRCGPIEYARVGDGYPVLVVHGTFGGFDQGLLTARPLIEAGFQVIAVSRFGALRTPMPENATVDMQADAFACLLDALGIEKVAVFTASGGAVSSIRFAARYPERTSALVLVSPSAPGDVYVAPPPKAAFSLMRSDFVYWAMVTYLRPLMQRMVGVPAGFDVTSEIDAEITDVLATTLPSSARIDGFYYDNYGVTSEFYEEISETSPYSVYHIELPVLVISALDDPVAVHENVRGLAERFPNARLYVLPDGGHLILGHSEEVDAEIVRFLREDATTLEKSQ